MTQGSAEASFVMACPGPRFYRRACASPFLVYDAFRFQSRDATLVAVKPVQADASV